jgi:hypothetical protein
MTGEGVRMVRDLVVVLRLNVGFDLRATRAQAGGIAHFQRQRFKHGRVNAD